MKKFISILLLVLIGIAALKFGPLVLNPVPATNFNETPQPPSPNYENLTNWAALPDQQDMADYVPDGSALSEQQNSALVDVFYIHPTVTYFGHYWVSPVEDWLYQFSVDYFTLRPQASAFNHVGKIYAPRYRSVRQAIWNSTPQKEQDLAKDLAYTDVKRAFLHYLKNWNKGRPIIIASHSQGTMHSIRLLKELFDGKALQEKLVAAYIIGMPIDSSPFIHIPLCENPEQTHCYIVWNTVLDSIETHKLPKTKNSSLKCVNPLSWKADTHKIESAQNPGSVPLFSFQTIISKEKIYPALVSAQCNNQGFLLIDKRPEGFGFNFDSSKGIYHSYDFGFYYESIRKNAETRSNAFMSSSHKL